LCQKNGTPLLDFALHFDSAPLAKSASFHARVFHGSARFTIGRCVRFTIRARDNDAASLECPVGRIGRKRQSRQRLKFQKSLIGLPGRPVISIPTTWTRIGASSGHLTSESPTAS